MRHCRQHSIKLVTFEDPVFVLASGNLLKVLTPRQQLTRVGELVSAPAPKRTLPKQLIQLDLECVSELLDNCDRRVSDTALNT